MSVYFCHIPCSNKNEYGYCKTSYCINSNLPNYTVLPNVIVGSIPKKPKTNADRIRAMTDEELAEWFLKIAACPCDAMNDGCALNDDTCKQAWLDWLRKEIDDA